MDQTSILFAVCCAMYTLSGGRISLAIAVSVWVYIIRIRSPSTLPEKPSPILEVDFTHAYMPNEKTVFPQTVPLSAKPKKVSKRSKFPRVFKGTKTLKSTLETALTSNAFKLLESPIYIFYTTLTGSSHRMAKTLHEKLSKIEDLITPPKLLSLDDDVDDLEEFFLKTPKSSKPNIYLLVLPSYETDSPIDYFLEHLQETSQDLNTPCSWGGEKFCYQAQLADRWMGKLGARRLFPLGQVCMKHEGEPKALDWINRFAELLADDEPFHVDENDAVDDSDVEDEIDIVNDVVDVEDMGTIMKASNGTLLGMEPKQMVAQDSPTFKSLTKQGYTVVGSHSGVKICRWTKSAMRGRGSCYKFAFYGIRSHLCMETTPSLACSNKCVFCWRHGTNPVAKLNWRWEVDPPEKVLHGALEGHYKKIKQMRGVPGIQMERFEEAFQVRHCALSLVGEPIFYPHINEFVGMLHDRDISSFLVCNAQHPANLEALDKVTQLYVSIDAPTKQDLKKVDRPLNSDFWERLIACLDILRTTQAHQRTVFRLTLVKGFNMGDIKSYADMVERAQPSQIEVKGATFCGSSTGNGNPLTMQNIPFYDECKEFVESLVEELNSRGQTYELAAEHAHSCCILIAHTKFHINGTWHTHIDYPKFFELLKSGQEFNALDYVKETPSWALWGSDEAGFNPDDTRYDRKAEKLKKKEARDAQVAQAAQAKEVQNGI
ncbi:hypothetical protein METBIDRAFT_30788 [Metschnikowia bicuspidata var. bicuspidata NRRL YB-4993]|uniref:S-adenosyl-L-methionine-dependent tRNA 4-demethylwyosine synthase n=1 Tax=Metschnikowia bicuspidata var. bicuspidata NRRL YB-4993 TaxID=869754 RepID=A0A1A0HK46_9ASCO|nr:hypothetical protein METBIDRAFT_30788 [Metschnikowia bicuspidata var. bicuspidata NRRL YB-4993]OBA24554.1 hypothetical protein METBIDRAFT_30788 [Metschnikowia bicuspidata var. bicuspidata NRRL YB-4993]